MNDQRFFDLATQEQRENKFTEALWLKAMALSDNDRNRAHAAYIVLRVEQIKDLYVQQLKVTHAMHKMFCTCPSCGCAGPFHGTLATCADASTCGGESRPRTRPCIRAIG